MLGEGGVPVGVELRPEGGMVLGADAAGAGAAGARLGPEILGRGQADVAFDGGQADGEARGDHARMEALLDDRLDDALA